MLKRFTSPVDHKSSWEGVEEISKTIFPCGCLFEIPGDIPSNFFPGKGPPLINGRPLKFIAHLWMLEIDLHKMNVFYFHYLWKHMAAISWDHDFLNCRSLRFHLKSSASEAYMLVTKLYRYIREYL